MLISKGFVACFPYNEFLASLIGKGLPQLGGSDFRGKFVV